VQSFVDSVSGTTRSFEARAIFADVALAGVTNFAALSAVSAALPAGVVIDPAVSVFVDVQTTAVLGGGVRVCLAFPDEDADAVVDGTSIPASQLRLLHTGFVGSPFADVPTDAGPGEVCGDVAAPGVIALGVVEGGGGGSTTTTVATGETTTTSTLAESTTTTSTVSAGPSTTTSSTAMSASSTTTSSTAQGAGTTTTSMPVEHSTTTTIAAGSTSTTCATTATTTTSSTTATTLTVPGPPTSTTTTVISLPSTTSSTLPVCATALECLRLTIAGPLCPGENLNPKLASLILRKLTKAQAGLVRARTIVAGKKAGKLVTKARKQLDRIGRKADAFVSKRRHPISADCRDRIRAALDLVARQIEAQRL
jgi:hypothetical protein